MAVADFAEIVVRGSRSGEIYVSVDRKEIGVLFHDGKSFCVRLHPKVIASINAAGVPE